MKNAREKLFSVLAALFVLAASLWSVVHPVKAQAQAEPVVIYLFWGDGCPHCAEEKPFLDKLAKKYPQVELREYEIWYNDANRAKAESMAKALGFEIQGVPVTIIGRQQWTGFNEIIGEEIETAVVSCSQNGCPDAGVGVLPAEDAPEPADQAGGEIDVPLIGRINLNNQSLLVSTLIISFVDGFNPCSIWVLSMLMALVVHTGSRRKIILIGLIFLTVTASIYALFIAGLFSVLSFIGYVRWVQVAVALISLGFAVINIKDYFWYKEGVSLTISDEQKPGIYERMRRVIASSDSLWGLATATIALGAGVSLVEFSCTAGFPVLWTNLLTAHQASTLTFLGLLLVYLVIYQLDELVIFFTVVFTLRASRLEEKEGRLLKLVGGMLMLALAIVMVINPQLMNNIGSSLLVFGAAFLATGLVLLLHRRILPSFGILIGTEMKPRKKTHRTKR